MTAVATRALREPARSAPPRHGLGYALALAAVAVVGVPAVVSVDTTDLGDLGLGTAAPVAWWAALAVLVLSFAVAVTDQRAPGWVLPAHVAVLVAVAFVAPALAGPFARDAVAWRHAGLTAYYLDGGRPDPSIDAYSSWPGFFVVSAFLARAAGITDAMVLARWAPAVVVPAVVGAVALLVRTLTPSWRIVWSAAWVFLLFDWIDQEYFAPQTAAYLLFLVAVAVVLRWLRVHAQAGRATAAMHWWRVARWRAPLDRWSRLDGVPASPLTHGQLAAAYVLVAFVCVVAVPTHQLTPFVLIISLALLAVVGRSRAVRLPVALVAVAVTYLLTLAATYLQGHPLLTGLGDLSGIANDNVNQRARGSELHRLVVSERLWLTAACWLLATAGFVLLWRRGRRPLTAAVLFVSPFLLLPMQTYGGEMVLRVHLFALPAAAFLGATALVGPLPRTSRRRWLRAAAVAAAGLVLVPALVVARYGNDRTKWFTSAEVALVDALYDQAADGALVVSIVPQTPWQHRDHGRVRTTTLATLWPRAAGVAALEQELRERLDARPGGGIVLLDSGREAAALLGGIPVDVVDEVERWVAASGSFTLIEENGAGRAYAFVG